MNLPNALAAELRAAILRGTIFGAAQRDADILRELAAEIAVWERARTGGVGMAWEKRVRRGGE